VPLDGKQSFVKYAAGGFGQIEQVQLYAAAARAAKSGHAVIAMNSVGQLATDLWCRPSPFKWKRVEALRVISRDSAGRAAAANSEVLAWANCGET